MFLELHYGDRIDKSILIDHEPESAEDFRKLHQYLLNHLAGYGDLTINERVVTLSLEDVKRALVRGNGCYQHIGTSINSQSVTIVISEGIFERTSEIFEDDNL